MKAPPRALSFEDTSELWQGVDPVMQEMMEACQEFHELRSLASLTHPTGVGGSPSIPVKEHMKAGK